MKKKVGTIDLTPTWKDIANIYIPILCNGTPKAQIEAAKGVKFMAELLDIINDKNLLKPGSELPVFKP